jgi:hypothetical protein
MAILTPKTQHFMMALKCTNCGRTGNASISQDQKTKFDAAFSARLDTVSDGFMLMSGDNWQFECTKCRASA